ncbi:patatin-like phospholipase family protein [Hyphomicrobium sp.]|uniref:patatin-like phospholipase family protein n=1 Tax=Hyphomicrobium sp. TaxID=82 RepID=UPI001D1D5CCA|nr:patatin-like phospholipase family protein [Hyphomicrobium sp.]MBY0561750.1 patatin-like phospholipase family protein [Hyphomicrobium sp.]
MPKSAYINLALQGGGAHGAFTWGVLDRLLEDDTLQFGWISATSAGAVNAVALAAGLAEGSRDKAREKMYKIWHAIHNAAIPDLTRLNPFLNGLVRTTHLASMLSPYEFNPLGFDPLRRLLTEHVDFELIRAKSPVELLIAATHVATGRARLFREHEITVDAVLASACLPVMHHAVEIDGAAYWDGGFSANPDLVTLASESPIGDTLLVMVAPRANAKLPTTARDISIHASRLTFNAPLVRDIEVITAVRETSGVLLAKGRLAPLCRHRFHLIDGGPVTGALNPETTLKPDWDIITYLHGAGREYADKWLNVARSAVGRLETVDLVNYFFPPVEDGVTFRAPIVAKRPVQKRGVGGKRQK